MLVIDYIRQHGLESLCAKYAIKANRHKEFPNLVLLKYDQIDSPMGDKVVQECRGLILDEADDWAIISRPYDKFFNYGEGHAPSIDWTTAKVYEKLDGSLMTLYWYRGGWRVASSGSPDASGPVNRDTSITFAILFWEVWNEMGYSLPPDWCRTFCFMFELMTPDNRIVVQHKDRRIVFHGVRKSEEEFPEVFLEKADSLKKHDYYHNDINWQCVKSYPLQNWEQIIEASTNLNPMQNEGFVVVDSQFNRVKVKSPQYVALAHMKDGFSDRRMIELVRTNESSEFLNYFPEFKELYDKYATRFSILASELEETYEKIKDIELQKDFAMVAVKTRMPSVMFNARNKKIPVRKSLADMSITTLEDVLAKIA